ncbi:MAG: cysteine hydrolase family protein [Clostridia bacterium]
MKKVNNVEEKSKKLALNLEEKFSNLPIVDLKELDPRNTVLVIMDMINGFAKKGALMDERIKDLIPGISELLEKMIDKEYKVLAFADYHDKINPEFNTFPEHSLAETEESEMVDELKEIGGYKLIHKNSTNGFFAPAFINWFNDNQDVDTYILVGDCTDICIMQFGLAMKAYNNQLNKESNIIVVKDLIDTYDVAKHDGDIINLFSLYIMQNAGIKIVKEIK